MGDAFTIVTGRLYDPQIANTNNGKSYLKLSIATKMNVWQDGESKSQPLYYEATYWGEMAQDFHDRNAFVDGQIVSIRGVASPNAYDGKDGLQLKMVFEQGFVVKSIERPEGAPEFIPREGGNRGGNRNYNNNNSNGGNRGGGNYNRGSGNSGNGGNNSGNRGGGNYNQNNDFAPPAEPGDADAAPPPNRNKRNWGGQRNNR